MLLKYLNAQQELLLQAEKKMKKSKWDVQNRVQSCDLVISVIYLSSKFGRKAISLTVNLYAFQIKILQATNKLIQRLRKYFCFEIQVQWVAKDISAKDISAHFCIIRS